MAFPRSKIENAQRVMHANGAIFHEGGFKTFPDAAGKRRRKRIRLHPDGHTPAKRLFIRMIQRQKRELHRDARNVIIMLKCQRGAFKFGHGYL